MFELYSIISKNIEQAVRLLYALIEYGFPSHPGKGERKPTNHMVSLPSQVKERENQLSRHSIELLSKVNQLHHLSTQFHSIVPGNKQRQP